MNQIQKEKNEIMDMYIHTFVNSDYIRISKNDNSINLIWCNFKNRDSEAFPVEELRNKLSPEKKVVFYNDRSDLLYKTNFSGVYEYIENLEPWEETDCVIFDELMKWTIAITHEDFIIVIGLDI